MLFGSELNTKIRSFLKEKTEMEKQKFAIKLEVTYVTVDDDTFEEIINLESLPLMHLADFGKM